MLKTNPDGSVTKLEAVYLRGSHIRLVVLPDLLEGAPILKGKLAKGGGQSEREIKK